MKLSGLIHLRPIAFLALAFLLQACSDCGPAIGNPDDDPGLELIKLARDQMCDFEDSDANAASVRAITALRLEIHELEKQVTFIPPQSTWPFIPSPGSAFDTDLFRVFDHDIAVDIRGKKQDLWALINARYNDFGVDSLAADLSDPCKTQSDPGHITGRDELASMRYNTDSETLGTDVYVGRPHTIFDWVDSWERHHEPIESFLRSVNLWSPLPVGLGAQSPILESHIVHQRPIWELANPAMFVALKNKIIPTVEVLVLYTEPVAGRLGADPEATVQQTIDLQNQLFSNSRVFGKMRLVGVELINDPGGDLELAGSTEAAGSLIEGTLATNDFFSVVARRESSGADLVSVWLELDGDNSFGSWGQQLDPDVCSQQVADAYDSSFVSVVIAAKVESRFHFGHEVGHNLGLSHDGAASEPPAFVEGRGFVITDQTPNVRTVMAYSTGCAEFDGEPGRDWNDCARIPHYSNPFVNFGGSVTGTHTAANAAQVLKGTLRFVARYDEELN